MKKLPKLTDEQKQALEDNDGVVEGPTFILMRTDVFRDILGFRKDEELRRLLST